MTLHVTYDHLCEGCGAPYIPYDVDVPCPKCGLIERERFDFIPKAVNSLQYNKSHGSYVPAAWWVGSLGDQVLSLLFSLFAAHEKLPNSDFNVLANLVLRQMDWGDQQYLHSYILEMALRVYKELTHSTR